MPRLKLSYKEMLESNNVITFNGLANSSSYHTFLLDEERSRLYVGAKDHIFSFNLVNIKDFQKIVWPVSYTRRDECKWAGKDILKECANFIKVLKAYNQTHLYACGTGLSIQFAPILKLDIILRTTFLNCRTHILKTVVGRVLMTPNF